MEKTQVYKLTHYDRENRCNVLEGEYYFTLEDGALYLHQVGGSSTEIKVHKSSEYVIKFNKKSVSGIDGAAGVFRFMEKAIRENFFLPHVNGLIRKFAV